MTRIGDLIGDPSNQKWSASKKQEIIEDAQEAFVLDTRTLRDTATTTVVDGTQEYSLPSDVLDVIRMAHKGIRLRRLSKFDLDTLYATGRDWTQDSGTPSAYYVDLDPNNKVFGLYPKPAAGDAGANLTMEYVKMPPVLTSDSSVPLDSHTLLITYQMAIAYWAAAYFLDIRPDQQAVFSASRYKKKYDELVSQCIETFKSLEDSVPLRMRGGRYFKGI